MLASHYQSPFTLERGLYRTSDIFGRLTANDLQIVPLQQIHIRHNEPAMPSSHIKKERILACDTRYPPIIYKAVLDPQHEGVKKTYCVFDGTHRILKMLLEGKKGAAVFILKPHVFEGLQAYDNDPNAYRHSACNACQE